MLYQQGDHNGSNMGPRMQSSPIYQDFQQKAAVCLIDPIRALRYE